MNSTTLLPGVYFQTAIPAVPEVLPRLDIPAFVGFAGSGPIHVPVVVEDFAYFLDIFGSGQVLARDPASGQMVSAQLNPAVSMFFQNGGRRCWVVRVAKKSLSIVGPPQSQEAVSNEFLVPGLLQVGPSGTADATWLEARSEGSWSDGLEVNATLSYSAIEVVCARARADGFELQADPSSPRTPDPGDVLEVVFQNTSSVPEGGRDTVAYLPVQRLETRPAYSPPGKASFVITGGGAWFDAAFPEDFPAFLASPPADSSRIVWLPLPDRVDFLTRQENQQITPAGWGVKTGQFFFLASRSDAQQIRPGSWLRAEFITPVRAGAAALLIQVQEVQGTVVDSGLLSPPAGDEFVEILAAQAWWQLDAPTAAQRSINPIASADIVNLELWVRDATQQVFRLSNLGLSRLDPRYVGTLPTDAQLYSATSSSPIAADSTLIDDVTHPRFALAAPTSDASDLLFVPLGVPGLVNEDFYAQAVALAGSALDRDGLSSFSPYLFLDPDLRDSTADALLAEAFHKQYQLQRDPTAPSPGEPLQGIHAILPIDEVSILSVPDAPDRGWNPTKSNVEILGAPDPLSVHSTGETTVVASWGAPPGAISYLLEQSFDPRFTDPISVWTGTSAQSDPLTLPETCTTIFYYRARANGLLGPGPWSVTFVFPSTPGPFELCDPGLLAAPDLSVLLTDRARTVLEWTGSSAADQFILQSSLDPTFELNSTLYQGPARTFDVTQDFTAPMYYRVAAQRGLTPSPWSKTIFTVPTASSSSELTQLSGDTLGDVVSGRGQDLSTIHSAMLRLCAARGDVVSVLSVPLDFETDACVLYRQQLASLLAGDADGRALSYGALFHPWLIASDTPGVLTNVVPDGAITGTIAARTIDLGAWYSPANQPLHGVLGIIPALPSSSLARFFPEQINAIRQDPTGFIAASSATLSDDSELVELTVRRLMILLRRLALRDGMTFVFESNDPSFQRRVRRQFEELLRGLYVRGAFAGATANQAFSVVADNSVNTQADVDDGRFIVELRVAPSRPLAFLTVRLVQAGGSLSVSEAS